MVIRPRALNIYSIYTEFSIRSRYRTLFSTLRTRLARAYYAIKSVDRY